MTRASQLLPQRCGRHRLRFAIHCRQRWTVGSHGPTCPRPGCAVFTPAVNLQRSAPESCDAADVETQCKTFSWSIFHVTNEFLDSRNSCISLFTGLQRSPIFPRPASGHVFESRALLLDTPSRAKRRSLRLRSEVVTS